MQHPGVLMLEGTVCAASQEGSASGDAVPHLYRAGLGALAQHDLEVHRPAISLILFRTRLLLASWQPSSSSLTLAYPCTPCDLMGACLGHQMHTDAAPGEVHTNTCTLAAANSPLTFGLCAYLMEKADPTVSCEVCYMHGG